MPEAGDVYRINPAIKTKSSPLRLPSSAGKFSPIASQVATERPRIEITERHGRSREVKLGETVSDRALWSDEYHIPYGARSVKGEPPPETPRIEYDPYSPLEHIRVFGLKDGVGLERISQVSAFMRRAKLPTERIVKEAEVLEVMVEGERTAVDEWKRRVIENQEFIDIQIPPGKNIEITPKDIKNYLNSTDFYVMERESQVGERLIDLSILNRVEDPTAEINPVTGRAKTELTGETFRRSLDSIFRWVNNWVAEAKKGFLVSPSCNIEITPFDITKIEDIKRYCQEFLPSQMGAYLADLHNLGVAHGWATAHNWTAVGTLVDLDSVHGRPLGIGNKTITINEISKDLRDSIEAIGIVIGSSEIGGYLRQTFGEEIKKIDEEAVSRFVSQYLQHRTKLSFDTQDNDLAASLEPEIKTILTETYKKFYEENDQRARERTERIWERVNELPQS